jgi:serine/threonine protein phosphatase PrpC
MIWTTAVADAIGGRSEQQDRVAAFRTADGSVCLAVVADGMGGHQGGALAAQAVVDAAAAAWEETGGSVPDPQAFVLDACRRAHAAVNREGRALGIMPHSTAVFLMVDATGARWCHVGDSRLYRFRGGAMLERTRDHSLVQLMVDLGEVRESDMATHPDQNKLFKSLGGADDPEPGAGAAAVGPDDAFLLCSDGLWEQISVEEMADALAADDLDRAAAELVDLAALRGGALGDNAAVALVRPAREGGGR